MAEEQTPFADVRVVESGFWIPELKWRELLFIGALKPDGGAYVRDPSRPLPPFRIPDLFPHGVRFGARNEGGRIFVRRVS